MLYGATALVAAGAYALSPPAAQPPLVWTAPPQSDYVQYPKGEKRYSHRPDEGVPVRYAETGVASQRFSTIPQMFQEAVKRKPNHCVMKVESPNHDPKNVGPWKEYTWEQYNTEARAFGKALLAVGFKRYAGVAVCAFNAPEWCISEIGCIMAGGMVAGTYTTNSPDACQFVADHSESVVVVVDTVKTLQKYLTQKAKMPTVKHIVMFVDDIPESVRVEHGEYVLSWADFLKKGDAVNDSALDERINAQSPGDACTLIYTSGTTGNPKAVMATHDGMLFFGATVLESQGLTNIMGQEHLISYLPLSHIAAQVVDILFPVMVVGHLGHEATIWFARPDALKGSLPQTLKTVRPTFFFGVPRVWEKIVEGVQAKARENPPSGLKLKLIQFAKKCGLQSSRARQIGGDGAQPWGMALATTLVHKKFRDAVGLDRCKVAMTGAAPIPKEKQEFLASLGLDLHEVYGMSESCGGGTVSSPRCFKFGSTGPPLKGFEVKIDHDASRDKKGEGEICYRGRCVMLGYYKELKKTQEAIDEDGWLHSGDVGRFDDGMLYITGRIKELIIGAGGENIAPVPIEDEIKRLAPAISNVIMIGDKRKYNTCLITIKSKPNLETGEFFPDLFGPACDVNPAVKTVPEAMLDPVWQKYIENAIKSYNEGPTCVSNAQKVQKFKILPTDLSVPGGELTGTMKVKRPVVQEKYKSLIEEMY